MDKRSHMYLINLVFPHPASAINTTGMLHLINLQINLTWMNVNVGMQHLKRISIANIFFVLSAVKTYDLSGYLKSISVLIPITANSLSNSFSLQSKQYEIMHGIYSYIAMYTTYWFLEPSSMKINFCAFSPFSRSEGSKCW